MDLHPAIAPYAPVPKTLDAAVPIVDDWLSSKSHKTRVAYGGDLRRFAAWLGVDDLDALQERVLGHGLHAARKLVLTYRAHLQSEKRSPATINRSLSAVRAFVDFARHAGLIDWHLDVKGLRARAYRDTSGPTRHGVKKLIEAAADQKATELAVRDTALVRLIYGLGLRRAEAVGLDIEHVDLEHGKVWILGKGHHDREPLTLPAPVIEALQAWFGVHPSPIPHVPLFVRLDARKEGVERLSTRSVARVLERLCKKAGVQVIAPHALRHAAITHALDATGGDVRRVRAFSRHAKIETVARYDDNRLDGGGEVAALVAL